ncbi:HD domain-containing phosphohydrolase [Marinobacterium rhizophilum]|uniref:HD domain-containing phosphohydrolase n=1 Tax=Marinobacterium rhizophilum TaxID=420402 RepID=UPI00037A2A63|nr:HD domain-containing phosphohydrolase [Marinobacterium rhizophilum]
MNGNWQVDPAEVSILVIDDEAPNLKLLQKMLASMGYKDVTLVQDPRMVIDHYRSKKPDLILLDLNMPHIDGFGILAQLQELDDPTLPPIIVLTAQTGRDFKLRSLNEGARDFLSKPFDRAELQARVRNLLDAHMAHRMVYDQKSVLDDLVRQRTAELRHTRLQVIERLGRAAEYRDNETGLHISRMSHYSRLIALRLGLSKTECDTILHASPMHDIGKIGIPDIVLLKPGKLTAEEFEVIKRHPEIGARLLDGDDSTLMVTARKIALTHHEKWDGTGYPQGLKGEEIPLAGRIVAVADVFDALTSVRPYKRAWSVEDAAALIRKDAGSHFDPQVVDAFMEALTEILSIKEQYRDADPELTPTHLAQTES